MNQARQTSFAILQAAMQPEILYDYDLFDIVGSWVATRPYVAMAMLAHAADITRGGTDDLTYTDIIIEVYRRTFFENEQPSDYGLEALSEENCLRLANHMAGSLAMDKHQGTHDSFLEAPAILQ